MDDDANKEGYEGEALVIWVEYEVREHDRQCLDRLKQGHEHEDDGIVLQALPALPPISFADLFIPLPF